MNAEGTKEEISYEQKINKNLLLMFLCVIVILGFRSSTVQAAMADEAEDYELGENYTGR